MASYIPNVTDYIPQAQPFSPDYNFLGNMLQNAQTKYDANYKVLSKTYGTLLNSPMLREDNIQQRDEFFKMIDNDIKRISGLDLSLQQNVDSANMVFESFYNNKEMVKDMTFTKEYQRQLQIGDNYRNCLSQDQCGGKYWDVGANALNYRADEFKKANRQDTLTMSPGRFVPMINIQEKAMKYATELLGKDGAFGIQTMTQSPDGRYNITMKNGRLLEVPLQQLLLNQYGKDQDIIDMYQTSAYVNRKSFIAANAEKYGSEDAAEDEYFRMMDLEVQNAVQAHQDALNMKNTTDVRKQGIEQKIRTQGSTGDDDLAFDYESASVDDAAASEGVDYHKQGVDLVNSIFDAGDNRAMKRQRVDALFARTSMSKEISDSATTVAALTGQMSYEADPYAKSYYDFSLEMSKMKRQYELMGEHEMLKASIELSKNQVLTEFQKRGNPNGQGNTPVFAPGYGGTTTGEEFVDESKEMQDYIVEHTLGAQSNSEKYVSGYANVLMGVLNDPNASDLDKRAAILGLESTFGKAQYKDGKLTRPGWDTNKKAFVGPDNKTYTDPQQVVGYAGDMLGWRNLYSKAQHMNKYLEHSEAQGAYLRGEGGQYIKQFDTEQKQIDASSKTWMQNNLNVRSAVNSMPGLLSEGGEKANWNSFFTTEGRIKTPEQFKKDYLDSKKSTFGTVSLEVPGYKDYGRTFTKVEYTPEMAANEADALYTKYNEVYNKVYNSGQSYGGKPLVEPLYGNTAFGKLGGGKTSGANIFTYNSAAPAELGTRGLLTFYQDALNPEALFTFGNVTTLNEATMMDDKYGESAKTAYTQLVNDFMSGTLSEDEKAAIGHVAYMDVALGNPNYVGIHFKLSQNYIDQYKKKNKDDASTWADDPNILQSGIAVYVPKSIANNEFTKAYKMQPYDVILNHQSETISYPEAGSVTINKMAPDGSFTVTGNMFGYDDQGNRVPLPEVSKMYAPGTGGQNIYTGIDTWMQQVNAINQAYKNNQPTGPLYFNPNELPNIQKGLQNQQTGDVQQQDVNTMFRQQLQMNMEQMQQLNM